MMCRFVQSGETNARGKFRSECFRCRRVLWSPFNEPWRIRAICTVWPRWHELGEWSAILLAAIGVTPRRYGWLRFMLGLDEPGACGGCEARKRWLNTLGGRLASSPRWQWLAAWVVRRR